MKSLIAYLILSFALTGCFFEPDKVTVKGLDLEQNPEQEGGAVSDVSVASVEVENDQLVITGSDLDGVTEVRMKGASGFDETFLIESSSESTLVANGIKNISFALGGVFDLILSDAQAAATFQVSFDLQDGAVTASKLDDMGASEGDALIYNQSLSTWEA